MVKGYFVSLDWLSFLGFWELIGNIKFPINGWEFYLNSAWTQKANEVLSRYDIHFSCMW